MLLRKLSRLGCGPINGYQGRAFVAQSEALRSLLVPVPDDADDVCPVCRSWRPIRARYCSNCVQAQEELSLPCACIIPISLYRRPSQLRDLLKYYKPGAEEYHVDYGKYLAIILKRFWIEQRDRLLKRDRRLLNGPNSSVIAGRGASAKRSCQRGWPSHRIGRRRAAQGARSARPADHER
jgi:hypothetical protein